MGYYTTEPVEDRGVGNQKSRVEIFSDDTCQNAPSRLHDSPVRKGFRAVGNATCTVSVRLYGYRYYNSELGRWPSRDPIGEFWERSSGGVRFPTPLVTDEFNLYAFAKNRPVDAIDALGLFSKIVNCCPCEEKVLKADEKTAQLHISNLKKIINGWIPLIESSPGSPKSKKGYPKYILADFKSALKVLDKASNKLKTGTAKCSPQKGKAIASAWPWGSTVTAYEWYWWYTSKARGAHLLHEGTHMGSGTTDAEYFWQNGKYPHNTFFFNFSQIASTYDTWILKGFCIPGKTCPSGKTGAPTGLYLGSRVCPATSSGGGTP